MSSEEVKTVDRDEMAAVSEEESLVMESKILTSVRYLKVVRPLPNRRRDDRYIYGKISITDDRANTPVTIFSRDRHNPQRITLGDDDFSHLSLSDHDSDRALSAFFRPLFLNMRLYEIDDESSSEEDEEEEKQKNEGVLIANIVGYEIMDDIIDRGRNWVLEGKCGFLFQISYAVIYGCRVEVEVKTNRPSPEEEGADTTTNTTLVGYIEACENLRGGKDDTGIVLYDDVYTPVELGAPFPLARKFLVAPTGGTHACLSIIFDLYNYHSRTLFASGGLSFPMREGSMRRGSSEVFSFVTNKDRTHVQHLPGNRVSVSIKFLDENMPGYWTP